MAGEIQLYIDLLSNNAGALSAISSLTSLDATVKKNDASIKALEKSYADTVAAANQLPKGGAGWASSIKAVKEAEDKLTAARQKQQLAVAKQDIYRQGLNKQVEGTRAAQAAEQARAAQSRTLLGALENIKGSLGGLAEQAKGVGGPVGSLVGKLEGLGKGGAIGAVIAIVVALGAAAAAAAYAAFEMTRFAITSADAARSSRLLSEAALGSAKAGDELETVVAQMSNLAPGLADKLKGVGRELAEVRIQGRDAQRALNTFGIVAMARGEQAAGAIKGIAESSRMANRLILGARDRFGEFASLKGTGVKAADIYAALAKSMRTSIPEAQRAVVAGLVPFKKGLEALELAAQTKLGGVVTKQMMSLSIQTEKLKENLGKLFSGVGVEKFLEGLKLITDLFDSNTVTGYVLKEVFTAVFTKVADLAAKVFPYVQAAIQGVVAGVIIFATLAKQVWRTLESAFGGAGKNIDGMQASFKLGVGIVAAFVGSIVALTAAFAILGAVALLSLAPIWVPVALTALFFYAIVKAIDSVIDEAKSLGKELESIDLAGAAGKIMDGFVKGIKSKIHEVKDAIREVSEAITSTFASDQEIRSPGRKAMRAGANVTKGVAIGEMQELPMAERASMEVSRAATVGPGMGGTSSGRGGGVSADKIELHFHGLREDDVAPKVREVLTEFLFGEINGKAVPA